MQSALDRSHAGQQGGARRRGPALAKRAGYSIKPLAATATTIPIEPVVLQESDFDPYYKWLGIPPQHQPPDHYRLLGLEAFESDRDVVRAAAERQMAHVQSYKIGPRSDLSQRLLNEIAKAKVCLLDTASKAEYDRALRPHFTDVLAAPLDAPPVPPSSTPTPIAPPPRHVVPAHTPSNMTDGLDVSDPYPSVRVRPAYRPRKRSRNIGIVIAIWFLAFLLLGIAVALLLDIPTPIDQLIPNVQNPRTDQRERQQPPPKAPTPEPPPPQAPTPHPREPGPAPNSKLPVPTAEQIAKAKAAIQIGVPLTSQELLKAADDATKHAWSRYVLYQMTIEAAIKEKDRNPLLATPIALQAVERIIEQYVVDANALRTEVENKLRIDMRPDAPVIPTAQGTTSIDPDTGIAMVELPDRNTAKSVTLPIVGEIKSLEILAPRRTRLKFSLTAAPDGLSWTITDGQRAIAQILRDSNGKRHFILSWEEGSSVEAECLRNAVLMVKGGAPRVAIALRRTVEIEAPLVNLSDKQNTLPIDVPLWGLDPRDLNIEAVGVSNLPLAARFPTNGRAEHRKPVRLVIRDELPKAGVELALHGAAPLDLRIKPILEDFDNKLYPWTKERMKNLEGAFVRQISRCQKDILELKSGIPNLEAQLAGLKRQYNPNALTASIVKSQIDQVAAALNAATAQLARLEASLPVVNRQVQAFGELYELTGNVHQRTHVSFRVFYIVGEHEVTVLRAGSSERRPSHPPGSRSEKPLELPRPVRRPPPKL